MFYIKDLWVEAEKNEVWRKTYMNTTFRDSSKHNQWLFSSSVWFRPASIVLDNDNRP